MHPLKVILYKEVIWCPPLYSWVKVNTNDASCGTSVLAPCEDIFRDHDGNHLDNFACNLGSENALYAEIMGVILAMKHASTQHWNRLWLETDYKLVVLAYGKPFVVSWRLRYRWKNCMQVMSKFSFLATHIYNEENHCADKFANLGLVVTNYTWWNCIHPNVA